MIELDRYTIFPNFTPEQTVQQVYAATQSSFFTPRDEVYISCPMTSGGYMRLLSHLFGTVPDDQIIQESLRQNSRFVKRVAPEIAEFYPTSRITMPPPIVGKKETEVNRFWLYYLSGISPHEAQKFEDYFSSIHTEVDKKTFDNPQMSHEKRSKEYNTLLKKFIQFVEGNNCNLNPVKSMVLMPDHQRSLGCNMERQLAQSLGATCKEVYFDQNHPRFSGLNEVASWLTMKFPNATSHVVAGTGEKLVILKDY